VWYNYKVETSNCSKKYIFYEGEPKMIDEFGNLDLNRPVLKKVNHFTRLPMPYGRVLIVDDVEANIYVAKELLLLYKLNVEAVESGGEAVDLITAGNTYDIIFMDHLMPVMDGLQATAKLRALGYEEPIIALTANINAGVGTFSEERGFSGFIAKPIDSKELDDCLMRFIRDKQPPEALEAAEAEVEHSQEGHTPALSMALIEAFIRSVQKASAVIKYVMTHDRWNEDDFKSYITHIHGIRGALGNISQHFLYSEASVLEQAGIARNFETIEKQTPIFLTDLENLIQHLSADNSNEKFGKDPHDLKEKLLKIHNTCRAFDIEGVNNSLNDLKHQLYSEKTTRIIEEIWELILRGDFDTAADVALVASYDCKVK